MPASKSLAALPGNPADYCQAKTHTALDTVCELTEPRVTKTQCFFYVSSHTLCEAA